MNTRILLIGFLALACLGVIAAVFAQRRELTGLRADQARFLAQLAATPDAPFASPASPASRSPSSELLKLRSTVTQLMRRKSELAGARNENEQLRSELAAHGTNASARTALPPDYIRASQAQWVGLSTPESTIQSFLWALRTRDVTNLLHTLTVESGEQVLRRASEDSFDQASGLPGARIISRHPLPDGSVEATVEFIPGDRMPPTIHFYLINGQWKMDMP